MQLLLDLHISIPHVRVFHCDNLSTMALATNLVLHFKAKNIEIDCHFVRECVHQGTWHLQFVYSTNHYVDVLIKKNSVILSSLISLPQSHAFLQAGTRSPPEQITRAVEI